MGASALIQRVGTTESIDAVGRTRSAATESGTLARCLQSRYTHISSTETALFSLYPTDHNVLVYLCHAGTSFATKLAELTEKPSADCTPIFAFFDIDFHADESSLARRKSGRTSWSERGLVPTPPASTRREFAFASQSEEMYGLPLLSTLSTDIQIRDAPNLIVPVAILRSVPESQAAAGRQHRCVLSAEPAQVSNCLDAGAVDVLACPLDPARVHGLLVHAYRTRRLAQREMSKFLAKRKLRKQSWVGVHDGQPYAYLREAMVSKLLKGICNPEDVIEEFQDRELLVDDERRSFVKQAIGRWDFTAQHFSEDELVFGACEMLAHAFHTRELDYLRLTSGELRTFLLACRAAYNSFVLYHNFRHAIDVLQSLFCFLLHIGALPPYGETHPPTPKSPIAALLSPFDALALLVSAIGHDVGHPGVNNFFLVKLNAPLAQLYNDNSVLEAFHCAAYSQILRRHWPAAFQDNQLRKLLISTILATDMGVHQKFIERMGSLQEKYHANADSLDGWKPQDVDQYKTLLCGLLIKCADISNVARPWDVAERWTKILQEEFANQGEMEKEVGMETALFGGPPELGNIFKLATGQIGFMSIFALPLFEGVADLLPQMSFTVDQIRSNQSVWRTLADKETKKKGLLAAAANEGAISPRTHSPQHDGKSDRAPTGSYFDRVEMSSVDRDVDDNEDEDDDGDAATSDHDAEGRHYESPHSSIGSVPRPSHRDITVNPSSDSPDTRQPAGEIAGDLAPDAPPSRKSSCAIPGLTLIPVSVAAASGRDGGEDDRSVARNNRISDGSEVAAVLYSNAVPNGADPTARPTTGDSKASRPSSGDPRFHHHTNSRSTAPAAAATGGIDRCCSAARTHSASTNSNPVMTPVSPMTNATSVPYEDSVDGKGGGGSSIPDGCSTRPSSSEAGGVLMHHPDRDMNAYDRFEHYHPRRGSHPVDGDGESDKHQIRTTIVGSNGANSPTPSSTATGESTKYEHQHHHHNNHNHNHHGDDLLGIEQGARRLLKRGSRLRLAFWKRKGHHHHHSHHPPVSNEI